ncbi:snare associated Golgi protein-domain-containing protein [Mycena maculata]|uniref:Golgi apparatus membrane protein TVP38 n=1 Tax=Mycena maculata TaxID=230809 RepID=A0AAD7HML1_9AGAR|nr:snare associated Golgi protein-domain-containing protein [Mycena maculata]
MSARSQKTPTIQPYEVYAEYPPKADSRIVELVLEVYDPPSIPRTPSPTRSEQKLLTGQSNRQTIKENIRYLAILLLALSPVIVILLLHTQIVDALHPELDWLNNTKYAFLIPAALLIIVSFPPLFGHELINILCGVAFSFPRAFGIIAVGSLLGEIANYFTFKYACTARGVKMEAKDISYGLLAHVVRRGGFWIVLLIRYSAIPAHYATTIFSTVNVPFWSFLLAAILSLPKQMVTVYIGYSLKPSQTDNDTSNIVSKVILGLTVVITLVALWFINRKMKAARDDYVYSRRKGRQGRVEGGRVITGSDG